MWLAACGNRKWVMMVMMMMMMVMMMMMMMVMVMIMVMTDLVLCQTKHKITRFDGFLSLTHSVHDL